ncbi:universal stress protein [Natronobeatus ordinarius]|uniref:universal stress protein n=1 Tax=Natronobeatus ordinarius TaxID=2963433 RepID=UPI0020CF7B2B|nr:universal stress protein [Natronobeatus ordinarius]
MATHVLVPIDDSDQATKALEFALEEHADAQITALNVIDPSDFYAATGIEGGAMANYEQIRENHENRAKNLLEEASKRAADAGVEIETDHVLGGVSRTIIEYADEHDVDHVVIGSHGRTGASRILLGSVAERVARRSPVPVTIVR